MNRETNADSATAPAPRHGKGPGDLARIQRAKNEWEAAVDAVNELVFLTDHAGAVVRCNRPARDFLGRPYTSIQSRRLDRLLQSVIGSGKLDLDADRGEFRIRRGDRIFEYSRSPATLRGQALGLVYVFRDVTDLRHIETVAARVDMMNNLGQVLSYVRHEIGNPINALKTALTVMSESLPDFSPERLADYVGRCLDDVARVQGLLDQLRTFNFFEVEPQEGAELGTFLENAAQTLAVGLNDQAIDLQLVLPEMQRPIRARFDPRALYQVILGLISNSAEAMAEQTDHRRIVIELRERHHRVEISIADSGPGIAPEDLPKVALPLFTTKAKGTGLGLAIADQMVTSMGGELRVGNDPVLGGARVVVGLRASSGDDPDPAGTTA